MIDWLLKDEKKNKVGRPKLADDKLLRKSRIMLISAIIVVFILVFLLSCYVKKESPVQSLYKMTVEKVLGPINNKNGFIVTSYYNNDSDYVMNIKVTNKLKSYSASYMYTTYYMKNNKWEKYESKIFDNDTNNFKITFKSKKNKNMVWKVKLRLVNASKIVKDYTPYDWSFKDSNRAEENYAYKVLTVKGYYSPVPYSEIKEIKEKDGEFVFVETQKESPRKLEIHAPGNFTAKIRYNDTAAREDFVYKKSSSTGVTYFEIPDMNALTTVHVYVWVDGYDKSALKNVKLSNWLVNVDSSGNYYITNKYFVVPSKVYK